MNNENFAGIMGTVKQAEVTNGVCGYDTENLYVVLRVCVPRKSGAEDTVIVAAKIKENENIDAEAIARNKGFENRIRQVQRTVPCGRSEKLRIPYRRCLPRRKPHACNTGV